MKPDLLVTWPTNCDYPPWRRWLQDERERFAKVIVVFSPHPGRRDYEEQAAAWLAPIDVQCLPSETTPGGRDWRDYAVTRTLGVSDSDWVLFAEQDFFIKDPMLWHVMETAGTQGAHVIGTRQDQRWHPCWLLVAREKLNLTSRYFGSEPVDHFYRFGQELREAGAVFADVNAWLPGCYYHMAGLSRNHQLQDEGRYDEIYKPEEFRQYLRKALSCGVKVDFGWAGQAADFLGWYAWQREKRTACRRQLKISA